MWKKRKQTHRTPRTFFFPASSFHYRANVYPGYRGEFDQTRGGKTAWRSRRHLAGFPPQQLLTRIGNWEHRHNCIYRATRGVGHVATVPRPWNTNERVLVIAANVRVWEGEGELRAKVSKGRKKGEREGKEKKERKEKGSGWTYYATQHFYPSVNGITEIFSLPWPGRE